MLFIPYALIYPIAVPKATAIKKASPIWCVATAINPKNKNKNKQK